MSRRYYRRRSNSSDGGLTGLVVIVAAAILIAHQAMSPQTFELLLVGLSLIAVSIVMLVVYLHFRRLRRQRQKLQALSMVDVHVMDGLEFEKYVATLLRDRGFTDVALTEKYDYGVDIIAVKDGIRWGVQTKRHKDMVGVDAIRQVVTALNHYKCQRAMVVTNSFFSRFAKNTAESNDCVLIDRDMLAEWMIQFSA
jgi:restriction system protein